MRISSSRRRRRRKCDGITILFVFCSNDIDFVHVDDNNDYVNYDNYFSSVEMLIDPGN
jgi:hypothetical protein